MNRRLTAVKLVLLVVFVALTNDTAKLGDRIDNLVRFHAGYQGLAAFVVIWLACLAGFCATAFLPKLWQRLVLAVPLLAGTVVGVAYERIASVEIGYDAVAIMREAVVHFDSAAAFYLNSIGFASALALVGAVAFLLPWRSKQESVADPASEGFPRWGSVALSAVALLPFLLITVLILFRGGYGTSRLAVQQKVPSLFLVAELSERLAPELEREEVRIPHSAPDGVPPHVILVIDESVRGDYLDVNISRGTTPGLVRYANTISNFGHAVAAGNCSASTNLILRTGAMPQGLLADVASKPLVWDYARSAGVNGVYLEAQTKPSQPNNRMSLREMEQIAETIHAVGNDRLTRDLDALDKIRELLRRREPQFIYLVKSGLHFPYQYAHPPDWTPFKPHQQRGQEIEDKGRLENSYKNAISWSTDQFFVRMFRQLDLSRSVLLYTSDHGQNLLDSPIQLTHCSNSNTSPYEGLVPLFVATDDPRWKERFERAARKNLNHASHFNVFGTLLVLFGYDREAVAEMYEPSLLDSIDREYEFASGLVSEYRLSFGSRTELRMHRIPRQILDSAARPESQPLNPTKPATDQ